MAMPSHGSDPDSLADSGQDRLIRMIPSNTHQVPQSKSASAISPIVHTGLLTKPPKKSATDEDGNVWSLIFKSHRGASDMKLTQEMSDCEKEDQMVSIEHMNDE
eukprot:5176053-Amphidinium_carterae.1